MASSIRRVEPQPRPDLLLFTSAHREQYTRDFLACLAAPSGHQVTFSYKKKWIASQVLDEKQGLRGRRGLIVFCAPAANAGAYVFHPVRWCQVRAFEPAEIIDKDLADQDTHLGVTFSLGQLFYATPRDV